MYYSCTKMLLLCFANIVPIISITIKYLWLELGGRKCYVTTCNHATTSKTEVMRLQTVLTPTGPECLFQHLWYIFILVCTDIFFKTTAGWTRENIPMIRPDLTNEWMNAQACVSRPIRADWAFSRRGSLKGQALKWSVSDRGGIEVGQKLTLWEK